MPRSAVNLLRIYAPVCSSVLLWFRCGGKQLRWRIYRLKKHQQDEGAGRGDEGAGDAAPPLQPQCLSGCPAVVGPEATAAGRSLAAPGAAACLWKRSELLRLLRTAALLLLEQLFQADVRSRCPVSGNVELARVTPAQQQRWRASTAASLRRDAEKHRRSTRLDRPLPSLPP